jgi:nucleoid-associated protein YgaU
MALEKAILRDTAKSEDIPVLFNPEEYTLSKDNSFAQMAVPGLRAPLLQFVNGGLQTLEMELLVDTYEEHCEGARVLNRAGDDVRILTGKVAALLEINRATHAPPVLLFIWGSLSFTCVLTRLSQRFIMFRPDGVPVRARLTVSLSEFTNAEIEAKEIKRETADYTSIYVVTEGDHLSAIATRAYGDPALWKPIALRNRIAHPRRLPTGLRLVLPQLPYRDPESGEVYQ